MTVSLHGDTAIVACDKDVQSFPTSMIGTFRLTRARLENKTAGTLLVCRSISHAPKAGC
jgi:hypothetical protein